MFSKLILDYGYQMTTNGLDCQNILILSFSVVFLLKTFFLAI